MSDSPKKRARVLSRVPSTECRACLIKINDDSSSVDIFRAWDPSWLGMGASIAQDLTKLSNIQISVSDPHSKTICKRCCIRLQDALEFTLRVQKNDLILRKRHIESSNENPQWPKPIQVDKNLSTNTLNAMPFEVKQEVLSDDEYESIETFSEPIEPNLDIKIEPEEITPMGASSIEIEIDEPAIKKAKTTNGPTELLVERCFEDVKEEPLSEEESEAISDMPKDCMLCLKSFNTVKGLKAHVIALHSYDTFTSPKLERTNVCATCNRSFATRTDLFVHETCHSKFACYVCDQKFDTFQLLTKHRSSCMRTCEIPRLKTLEDVRRPPVYYILDKKSPALAKNDLATNQDSIKISSHFTDTQASNLSSVETKTVPEPLDPGKYMILDENLPLESSQIENLATVKEKSAEEELPSESNVSETKDQSNKIMEKELKKMNEETNSSQKISDVIDITEENTQKSADKNAPAIENSESKKVEDIEQVEQSVTLHNNELSLKPEISNNNKEVDRTKVSDETDEIQENECEVSIENKSESEVSLKTKESELEIDNKLNEASNKMDVDTSEVINEKNGKMLKDCSEIKENDKPIFEVSNENSQKLKGNESDKKNDTKSKVRDEINEILESFETSSNEDSQELQDIENDKKNDNISKLRNEINEIVQSFDTSSNEDSQELKENEDDDNKNDNISEVRNETKKTLPNEDFRELQNNENGNKNDSIIFEVHSEAKVTVDSTFDTSPNKDSQKLKINETEESQSLDTCANDKVDSSSELTDTNKINQDLPLLPELNLKNVDAQCNPTKESMEIEIEVHSMDSNDDAMEVDNSESEIKASSESDKDT